MKIVQAGILPFEHSDQPSEAEEARDLALRDLRANVARVRFPGEQRVYSVLRTGQNQYANVWTRDVAYGVVGLAAAASPDDRAIARDTLEFLLRFAHPDTGYLPQNIDALHVVRGDATYVPRMLATRKLPHELRFVLGLQWFGRSAGNEPLPFGPPFFANPVTENGVRCIDGNLLVAWAAGIYVRESGDREFANAHYGEALRLVKVIEDDHSIDGSGLLGGQSPYSDWADSLQRTGEVGMTNAIHVAALREIAQWALAIGNGAEAIALAERAAGVRAAFVKRFLHSGEGKTYLQDFFPEPKWPDLRSKAGKVIAADVNFFSIAYGVVDAATGRRILDTLRRTPLYGDGGQYPGRAAWPNYPDFLKSPNVKAGNMADYHDEMRWPWLSAMAAMAEAAAGDAQEARRILRGLGSQAMWDQSFLEVYFNDPYSPKLYPVEAVPSGGMIAAFVGQAPLIPDFDLRIRAERRFSWAASLYLAAFKTAF